MRPNTWRARNGQLWIVVGCAVGLGLTAPACGTRVREFATDSGLGGATGSGPSSAGGAPGAGGKSSGGADAAGGAPGLGGDGDGGSGEDGGTGGSGGGGETCADGSTTLPCPEPCPVDGQVKCEGTCIAPDTSAQYCGATGNCREPNAGEQCQTDEECVLGGCRSWGAIEQVGVGPTYEPAQFRHAVDPAGSTLVVFSGSTSSTVAAARRPAGGPWQAPVPIGVDSAGGFYAAPKLAMDAAGNAIAAWRGGSDLDWARFTASTTSWSATAGLALGNSYGSPRYLESAPNGDTMMVFDNQVSSAGTSAWVRRYSASAGAWYDAEQVDENGSAESTATFLGIDSLGNAIITWSEGDQARAKRWDVDQQAWGPPAELGPTPYTFQAGTMNATGSANLAFCFRTDGGSVQPISYDAGQDSWSTTQDPIFDDDATGNDGCVMAGTPSGDAVLVWEQQDANDNRTVVISRRSAVTNSWQGVVELFSGSDSPMGPHIAADPAGNLLAVATRTTASGAEVVTRRWNAAEQTWGPEIGFGQSVDTKYSARVAFDGAGRALLLWEQYGTDQVRSVWARAYE